MGLQDLSLRLTDVEAATEFIQKWLGKNEDLLESAASLSDRVAALEKASISSYVPALKSYSALFGGDGLGFLFFTDPHNFSDNVKYYELIDAMRKIGILFENSPARFVLCGGDMINQNHTLADAKYYLGRIPNMLREEISNRTYLAPGNHDLNVHSPVDGSLTEKELAEIWYGTDVGYYYFDDVDTRCFVFDSGTMSAAMTDYRWQQVDWFANQLIANDKDHIFGLMHIVGDTGTSDKIPAELSLNITALADAFNTRQVFTLNGVTYDFSESHGTFHFLLAGHHHADNTAIVNYIPVLYTKNDLSVDLCFADWDAHVLRTVRYPTSELSRTLSMAFTGPPDNALPIWGITTGAAQTTVNRSNLSTSNTYGTSIDSTDYTGTIVITQSKVNTSYTWSNYRNGYISFCVSGMQSGKTYRLTADCSVTDDKLGNNQISVFARTDNTDGVPATITDGKIDVQFTVGTASQALSVTFRVGGKSMILSNVKFELVENA